MRVTAHL